MCADDAQLSRCLFVIVHKGSTLKEKVMNVVYNSKHYWVFAYPEAGGIELFDKECCRTLFLQGASAQHFHSEMLHIPEERRDEEGIDTFLDDYCAGQARPIVFH